MQKITSFLLLVILSIFVFFPSIILAGAPCINPHNCRTVYDTDFPWGATTTCDCDSLGNPVVCGPGYYVCDSGWSAGGPNCCAIGDVPGGGGGQCVFCSSEMRCKKDGVGEQGEWCGWTSRAPQQMKYWYKVVTACWNICTECATTAPNAPTAVSPVAPFTSKTASVPFSWTAVTTWGEECTQTLGRRYEVCVGSDSTDPCTEGELIVANGEGVISATTDSTNLAPGINYWSVRSKNNADLYSERSSINNFCNAGPDAVNPWSVTDWSACDPNTHKRTRTCIAGCDCTGVSLSEVCQAEVRGTIFDASNRDACPTSDGNGYLTGLTAEEKAPGLTFSLTDQAGTPPTGWNAMITKTTTSNGNYSALVYAPATYIYDFSSMAGAFDVSAPKLICNSSTLGVPGSGVSPVCLTQPCTLIKNMSFGFNKIFGGWWQVVGGSIYAASGIVSNIPASVAIENQHLILADGNGRTGLLSYGVPWVGTELGSNPNMLLPQGISSDKWKIQSTYESLRFDYDFYEVRMDIFGSKPWEDNSIDTYDDGELGYQIFKDANGVNLNSEITVDGGKKVVLLVDGNVNVNQNITVESGSFLAIISSGTITFAPDVAKAQGWFVAENISIPCKETAGECDKTDVQFAGEGSFVGYIGISLGRDQGATNNTQPSEKFTYRPDFMINIPTPMKVYTRKFSPFIP